MLCLISALIEIMPVGYTDYAFNLLAESCKIWYFELQSMRPASTFVTLSLPLSIFLVFAQLTRTDIIQTRQKSITTRSAGKRHRTSSTRVLR